MRAKIFAASASLWRACVAGVVISGLLSCAALADRAITGIDVVNKVDRAVISVQGNCALRMTPMASARGNYLGFQFPCNLRAKGHVVGIRSGRIYNVKYTSFSLNPPTTRIVVNTASHMDYSTEWSADKKHVDITVWKHGVKPVISSTAAAPKPEPTVKVYGMIQEAQKSDADVPAVESAPANMNVQVAAAPKVKTDFKPVVTRAKYVQQTSAEEPELNIARTPVEKKVSLNFLGADINDVIKALAVQSGENVVASKDVKGDITVSLSNVTIEEALDYVAKLSGYSYQKINNTYMIAPVDSLKSMQGKATDDNKLEFVWIQYANAEDIKNLLGARYPKLQVRLFAQKNQMSETKEVDVTRTTKFSETQFVGELSPSSDMLVLSGTQSMIDEAKVVIQQIEDSVSKQKEAARKWIDDKRRAYYRIKYADSEQLAQTLTALVPSVAIAFAPTNNWGLVGFESAKSSSEGIPSVERKFSSIVGGTDSKDSEASDGSKNAGADKSGNQLTSTTGSRTLIIVGKDDAVEKALELAAQLDVKAPQIKIDAKITSINATGEKQLGLTWEWDKIGFGEVATNAWTRGTVNFAATLEGIIRDGNGTLLASPSIVCLERNPGVFFVGDEATYVTYVETTPTGKNIKTETKRVGIQLLAVGESNTDGYITLYLHPQVSTLKLLKDQSADIVLPTISSRFTDHVVRVKDGETIVIGGLINNEEIKEMSKVPLLGDLPFLGNLFRHVSTTRERTEVVMFITASIIKE